MRIFDLHCDTLFKCLDKNIDMEQSEVDINSEFESWVQTFAIWISDKYRGDKAYNHFLEQYEMYKKLLAKYNKLIPFNKKEPKQGCNAMLSVESGAVLGGRLDRINELVKRNISMLTLTWNGENELGGGADTEKGLSELGFDAIRELEGAGVVIDVSHLSQKSFKDTEKTAKKAFIASHSNAFEICKHRRNLTDYQIDVIKERGGLIGLNFHTEFLREGGGDMQDVIRHADYFLKRGCEDILAIGSDFDGAKMPKNIKNTNSLEKLYESMIQYCGRKNTEKIFYENSLDFFMAKKEK